MNLNSIYTVFSLNATEILIFESLLLSGPQKASLVAKNIKTNRTTVYNHLKQLMGRGLIYETINNGVKLFAVQPREKINFLIQEKEEKFKEAKTSLDIIKDVYAKQNYLQPRIQIFENQKELQQMMNDMLLYQNITVLAYWPILKVMETLGKDFLAEFQQKRIACNINLKTIWPSSQIPTSKAYKFLEISEDQKREVRIVPANTNFDLGYVIYKNTVRFISSAREDFGFLIESQELAETMKGQFELIWKISKPLKKN